MQGVTRVPGGSVTNEDTSPGPVKRTCGTVVPYIYMYIYNSNPIACDGIRVPTDQWHDPFLSSVISMVTPAWCHGANRGQPCLGRMWTDVTSEFTHFNLVIRLSNVKQLAIPFTTILRFLAARAVLVNPWNPDLCSSEALPAELPQTSFLPLPKLFAMQHVQEATSMSSSCRFGLFGIWWGQTSCASNSFELERPLNAHVVWPTTVPSIEGLTHDSLGLSWIPFSFFVVSLLFIN